MHMLRTLYSVAVLVGLPQRAHNSGSYMSVVYAVVSYAATSTLGSEEYVVETRC